MTIFFLSPCGKYVACSCSPSIFYVELKDGVLHVEPYEYFDRDAMFTAKAETFMKIAEGKTDPIAAVTLQKLKVEGNIEKALKLKELIKKKVCACHLHCTFDFCIISFHGSFIQICTSACFCGCQHLKQSCDLPESFLLGDQCCQTPFPFPAADRTFHPQERTAFSR